MKKFVCQHNAGVDCEEKKCDICGWNPKVEKARRAAMHTKKYTIPFIGYCEVWAATPEEAAQKADNDEMYFAHYDFGDPICEEDENELD